MPEPEIQAPQNAGRLLSLDVFRGLTVATIRFIPLWAMYNKRIYMKV
jgi:predicted acyltransferase